MRNKHVSSPQKLTKTIFSLWNLCWFSVVTGKGGGGGGCGGPRSFLPESSLTGETDAAAPRALHISAVSPFPGQQVVSTHLELWLLCLTHVSASVLSSLPPHPPSPPSWGAAETFSDTSNWAITLEPTALAQEGSTFLSSPDSLLWRLSG